MCDTSANFTSLIRDIPKTKDDIPDLIPFAQYHKAYHSSWHILPLNNPSYFEYQKQEWLKYGKQLCENIPGLEYHEEFYISKKKHTVFVIDRSESMSREVCKPNSSILKKTNDNCLGAVFDCCNTFIYHLVDDDITSVILFNTTAEIIISRKKNSELKLKFLESIKKFSPDGGTNFSPALVKVKDVIHPEFTTVVIFLSDGFAEPPTDAIFESIFAADEKVSINTILFGPNAGAEKVLKEIAFKGDGLYKLSHLDFQELEKCLETIRKKFY